MKTQTNLHVIKSVLDWLNQGEQVWLCSITKTWGSSPMPAGTLMAYCSGHGVVGSLSGGCIEEDLLQKMNAGLLLADANAKSYPVELIYGSSEQQQRRFLLPCGGQLHLLIEYLEPQMSVIRHFNELSNTLVQRKRVARRVSVNDGHLSIFSKNIKRGIRRITKNSQEIIEHAMGPAYQMLLIGASEVARCVAELAQPLGFKVTVWDHRQEFVRNWKVDNVEIFTGSPEKLINQSFTDQNTAIIALAHDPRVDDFALVDALATNAFYIGAIGSTKTCHDRDQRLRDYLTDPAQLDKLLSPVGLDIGSKTPYEIAISILAEVVMKRRQLEKAQ